MTAVIAHSLGIIGNRIYGKSYNPEHLATVAIFHDATEISFGKWANGMGSEEKVLCVVNTAQAALDLVEAGVGISLMSEDCIQNRPGIRYLPMKNWHQALYMCILYDKWLEPPVWGFVEQLVKVLRGLYQT